MKIIVKDVELAYEDGEVVFDADIEVEIDEDTGEKTVYWAYAKEDVPHPNWNLKAGDRFDPGDSIDIEYLFEPDLDVPLTEVFTASEAEEKWGLKPGTVRASCTRGKLKEYIEKGQVKKSGNTWLVTKKVMEEVFGEGEDVQMKIINLTPHAITITDGPTFPPSGQVARVSTVQVDDGDINGVPVKKQTFGDIVDLPDPSADTIYIVSALVLSAAKAEGRTDVVAPDTANAVRNAQGHIVSVPGFVR